MALVLSVSAGAALCCAVLVARAAIVKRASTEVEIRRDPHPTRRRRTPASWRG